MEISDLLSFIGIGLAILAFLDNSDRAFIKNKFTNVDFSILILIFLFLHILIFNSSFSKVFPLFKSIDKDFFPTPKVWAYIVSILTICWVLLKIFYLKFPRKNDEKLLLYYQNLLLEKDYSRISYLINNYHNDLNPNSNPFHKLLVKEIISDDKFIESTLSINRDLFCKLSNSDAAFFKKYLHFSVITNNISIHPLNSNNFFVINFSKIDFGDLLISLRKNIDNSTSEKLVFCNLLSKKIIKDSSIIGYYSLNKNYQEKIIKTIETEIAIIDQICTSNLELIKETYTHTNHFTLILKLNMYSIFEVFKLKDCDQYIIDLISSLITERNSSNINLIYPCFKETLEDTSTEFLKKICNVYDQHFPSDQSLFKTEVIEKLKNY